MALSSIGIALQSLVEHDLIGKAGAHFSGVRRIAADIAKLPELVKRPRQ
jgi:hypothetical protein